MNVRTNRGLHVASIAVAAILFLAGCRLTLVGQYDETIDKGITDFEKRMDLFLIQEARTPIPPFNQSFYDETLADLKVIETRAAALPNDELTAKIVMNLEDQVKAIQAADKAGSGTVTPAFFTIAQTTIDGDCQRALRFELAKKQ